MASADPNGLLGAVLSQRWRLVGLRGEGGIGVVYEVESLQGEGTRAAKLLRREFCGDAQVVERFLDEARATARIDHPAIARVYEGARAEDGTPYLVMELLRGEPLSLMMNRGRLPAQQAVSIAQELLSALVAAHQAGVVHRDLKPDNVFVTQEADGSLKIKVLDFGVARVMDVAGGMARRTRTGMLLGTPGYMSPEQIKDVKHADARADLWGVGVILYEMLTGALAFDGENDFARITKVLLAEATPIEQVAPQYAHFGGFFARALAADVQQRFQSAAEMAEALRTVAQPGQQTPGAPVPGMYAPVTQASAAVTATLQSAGPFGNTDTAVSAGVGSPAAAGPRHAPPLVQVLPAPVRRGVPGVVVAVLVVVALLVGIGIGYLIGAS